MSEVMGMEGNRLMWRLREPMEGQCREVVEDVAHRGRMLKIAVVVVAAGWSWAAWARAQGACGG